MALIDVPLLLATARAQAAIGVPDAPGVPWLRIVFTLLFCIAIAATAIFALKRFGLQNGASKFFGSLRKISTTPEINVIETRRASVHGQLCLFECRDHAYVVVITAGGATLIDRLPIENRSDANA